MVRANRPGRITMAENTGEKMSNRISGMRMRVLLAAASLAVLAACGEKPAAPAAETAAPAAKPSDDAAWPKQAVADPTSLGFTAEGLAALDARLRAGKLDGESIGVVLCAEPLLNGVTRVLECHLEFPRHWRLWLGAGRQGAPANGQSGNRQKRKTAGRCHKICQFRVHSQEVFPKHL